MVSLFSPAKELQSTVDWLVDQHIQESKYGKTKSMLVLIMFSNRAAAQIDFLKCHIHVPLDVFEV